MKIVLKLPEYLLIAAVIFYWFSSGNVGNPIAIGLLTILIFQIIFKNRIVGLIIPSILILACLYMLLALFSEFNEFPSFNAEAKKLLFVGLSFFISTIMVSAIMIYKYSKIELLKNRNAKN
jgi:hypothetical protein